MEPYGDNFPVAQGLFWDPRTPWRHGQAMPSRSARRWAQVGWWAVVAVLMGLLIVLAAREGFSAEPGPSNELIVTFDEGVVRYPEGAASALLHQVEFRPASLQRLNARFGLVVVVRVINAAAPTARTFRLRFASPTGLARTLVEYRRDPHVLSAALGAVTPRSRAASRRSSAGWTVAA